MSCEHIVPESLGNKEHFLPPGVVCDKCNNYFSRKVEGPILTSDYYQQARNRNGIPSKRKRIPVQEVLSFPDALQLELGVAADGERYICPVHEDSNDQFADRLSSKPRLTVVHPIADPLDQHLFARFLLKMGLEALALRMLKVPRGIEVDHINNPMLDEARSFTRYGIGPSDWPFHQTQIYREGKQFINMGNGIPYDIPHEYTLLYTPRQEMYFVIAIFGRQFTVNLGGPELDGFNDWLASNESKSPLYPEGT